MSLLKAFLQRKVELRNVEEISPAQLNELLSEFVFTVRSKDGKDLASGPAVLMNIEGELFHKNYAIRTTVSV